ncbi:MAG: polysaccharide pyruvyl transferase CsaB [bacterium]
MADRQCAVPRRHCRAACGAGAALGRPAADRVLISGYYGFGNLGDEAVLAGLLAELRARRPENRITVLSADPSASTALHGVEAWPRTPTAVWRALRRARLLISGGGSLVQDVTSARSALYYLGVMAAASARHVPVAVIGQGVGPVRRPWVRRLTRWTFDRADAISLRDSESARTLEAIGVSRPVHRGADLAFLMPPAPPARVAELLARSGLDAAGARVGVVLRPWPGLLDVSSIANEVRQFAANRRAAVAVFLFDRVRDRAASGAVASAAAGRLLEVATPQDLLGLIGTMDLVVGVRLHALVFAVSQAVPAVGLAYDPKVAAFAAEQGLAALPVGAPAAALHKALEEAWDRREALRAHLAAARPTAQRAAAEAVGVAAGLLTVPRTREGRSSPNRA